jgi:hypothetical protein
MPSATPLSSRAGCLVPTGVITHISWTLARTWPGDRATAITAYRTRIERFGLLEGSGQPGQARQGAPHPALWPCRQLIASSQRRKLLRPAAQMLIKPPWCSYVQRRSVINGTARNRS